MSQPAGRKAAGRKAAEHEGVEREPAEAGSLRHVVCLTWKPGTGPDAIQAVADGLATLPAVVPGLRDYRFGTDLALADGNADFVIVGDFEDAAAWARYQQHPEHQRVIAELIRPITASRTAAQFVLPAGPGS